MYCCKLYGRVQQSTACVAVSDTVVPLCKDPSLNHILLTPKPSVTHKLPPLGRPTLYKVQFRWTSAAVFIEGKHCICTAHVSYEWVINQ